jgi:biotin carboxyl carrier protein
MRSGTDMDIEANGRLCRVAARRTGSRWAIDIDDRSLDVEAAGAVGRWSLLIGPAEGTSGTDGGRIRAFRSYDVVVDDRNDGQFVVYIDGRAVVVSIPKLRRSVRTPGGLSTAEESGPWRIAASMPGRVVKVLVRPGDRVEARQGLVVLEAMKMENEIRSPTSGTVSEVRVSEGSLVEGRTVLVVVE